MFLLLAKLNVVVVKIVGNGLIPLLRLLLLRKLPLRSHTSVESAPLPSIPQHLHAPDHAPFSPSAIVPSLS